MDPGMDFRASMRRSLIAGAIIALATLAGIAIASRPGGGEFWPMYIGNWNGY